MKTNTFKLALIIFVSLFILIFGFGYYLLNSSWFWEKLAVSLIKQGGKEVQSAQLSIQKTNFNLPTKLILEDVKLKIKIQEVSYTIDLSGLTIDANSFIVGRDKKIDLNLSGLRIESSVANLKDANMVLAVSFEKNLLKSLKGTLKIASADSNKYVLTNISADITGDQKNIVLDNFLASSYNGEVKGKITLAYQPAVTYDIALAIKDVDLTAMRAANMEVFSQVRGKLQGDVELKGEPAKIHSIIMNLEIPQEGQVKARLLKPFFDYIPQSTQKKDLELLMKVDGLVALDKAVLALKSSSEEKLSTTIGLESKRFNLDTHLTVDFNIEGGLQNLFVFLQKFLQ